MTVESANSLRLAFELALWRIQEQLDRARALDGRLANTFGLSAAMIALLGSALLFADEARTAEVREAVTAAAALFSVNIVISTAALLVGKLAVTPDLEELQRHVRVAEERELTLWAIEALANAADGNAFQLQLKGWLVSAAILMTAATGVAVASSAILAVQ